MTRITPNGRDKKSFDAPIWRNSRHSRLRPHFPRRFEDFGIDFVKKIGVEFLDRRVGVFFIDDETEVDVRGAMRNHQDIDIGNAAEGPAGDARRVLEIASDQADQRHC